MDQNNVLNQQIVTDLNKFRNALEKRNIHVISMLVFGSAAKNDIHPGSDIDICVVSSSFGKSVFSEGVELSIIAKKINPYFEPHPYNPNDFQSPYDGMAVQIRNSGIKIE